MHHLGPENGVYVGGMINSIWHCGHQLATNGSVNYCLTTDIDLKVATKAFSSHFSCGSSVTGDDEVVIQGDVCDNLIDFIPRHWPEVREFCFRTSVNHCLILVLRWRRNASSVLSPKRARNDVYINNLTISCDTLII